MMDHLRSQLCTQLLRMFVDCQLPSILSNQHKSFMASKVLQLSYLKARNATESLSVYFSNRAYDTSVYRWSVSATNVTSLSLYMKQTKTNLIHETNETKPQTIMMNTDTRYKVGQKKEKKVLN